MYVKFVARIHLAAVLAYCLPSYFHMRAKGIRMDRLNERLNTHHLQEYLMTEAVIDQLNLEIEELEKER